MQLYVPIKFKTMNRQPFKLAQNAAQQLLLFQNVVADAAGQTLLELVDLLVEAEQTKADSKQVLPIYGRLFRELAAHQTATTTGDWWQNHLLKRILTDHNPFSTQAYRDGKTLNSTLLRAAAHDLTLLHSLFALDGLLLGAAVGEVKGESQTLPLVGWHNPVETGSQAATPLSSLIQKFGQSQNWQTLTADLANFYSQYGTDELAQGRAFRWQRGAGNAGGGFFEPIQQVDEARLENLVGYDRVRAPLIQNTEQFLAGLPANHALLYGARGTGKSSTIKALLTRYGSQGLRLIEVHKNWLSDYLLIVQKVRGRREKFILFVDDLSFEADEVSYKDLKALLEGSLEARPANLLIYATSNRRHLVKEQFSDNGRPDDTEINAWDTVEEKLSLSDRFGLTLTFSPPNQPQYLTIVRALAQQAGLQIDQPELERRALQWEMRHSGFSGRLARQFIDQLAGEIGLKQLTNMSVKS